MSYARPYAGLKVVDLSQAIAGPYAASLLAQMGADVIKVEPPRGDWMRGSGKSYGGHTPLTIVANLGKRSLVVDLKTDDGIAIVQQLAATADVFIESFRPGIIARLGLGYEAVAALNPRIIYLSVSGFGQAGPLRERPGTDTVMQAFSGFMSVNKGNDDIPHRAGLMLADLSTALYNLQAIQAALWARQSEGTGRYIDSSLLRGAAAFHNMNVLAEHLEGPNRQLPVYPAGTYATADGYINIAIIYDREFPVLCDLLGLAAYRNHPEYQTVTQRAAQRATFDPILQQAFRQQSTDFWCERLTEARLLHERVHTYSEFLHHPQTQASGAMAWVEHPGVGKIPLANTPGVQPHSPDQPLHAPGVGAHTVEILRLLGYSSEHIEALRARGVVGIQEER